MSHIETGNTKLSLPVLAKIADELSVGVDALLSDAPKPDKAARSRRRCRRLYRLRPTNCPWQLRFCVRSRTRSRSNATRRAFHAIRFAPAKSCKKVAQGSKDKGKNRSFNEAVCPYCQMLPWHCMQTDELSEHLDALQREECYLRRCGIERVGLRNHAARHVRGAQRGRAGAASSANTSSAMPGLGLR